MGVGLATGAARHRHLQPPFFLIAVFDLVIYLAKSPSVGGTLTKPVAHALLDAGHASNRCASDVSSDENTLVHQTQLASSSIAVDETRRPAGQLPAVRSGWDDVVRALLARRALG